MKKVLLGLLFVIVIAISYLIYTELSFSPLKEVDFQKLFKGYIGKPNKICRKDFIGISSHGEIFDMYVYSTKNALIDKDFPKITEWENKKLTNASVMGKWRNCPLDSQIIAFYEPIFGVRNFEDVKKYSSFKKDIINPDNYYSYVYFSEAEEYFLLYCTDRKELYYIRLKGF